jgi:hypothetical protein
MPGLPDHGFARRGGQRTRQDRPAGDRAGGGAPSPHGGDLPVLRPARRGRFAGGGEGHAVWTSAPCRGDLSEDVSGAFL